MKTRIISAMVALLILVPLILLGGIYFKVGVCILAILGYKEIIDLKKSHEEYPNLMIIVGALSLIFLILSNNIAASLYKGFTYQLLGLVALLIMVPIIFYKDDRYNSKNAFYLLAIVFFLGLVFNLFIIIRMRSLYTFIYLIIIPIITDTFALLTGMFMGKHKLSPKISPKKTWEGSIGGSLFGTIIGSGIYYLLMGNISIKIIIITILLSIIGQIGDLVMSKIKRENEIKDFSNIMPGHGGILDRLDSIIFVFLAYIFLLAL